MADINITITIPDAYVQRVKNAIDEQDPLGGLTYLEQYKNLLRRWTKSYVLQTERNTCSCDEGIVT